MYLVAVSEVEYHFQSRGGYNRDGENNIQNVDVVSRLILFWSCPNNTLQQKMTSTYGES